MTILTDTCPRATPARAPRAALLLGFAGLMPFVGLALLAALGPTPGPALEALATYAAVILSFVGALHWCYALRADAHDGLATLQYTWSVLPSLVGWFALQLPMHGTLRVQALALVLCLVVDRALAVRESLPPWFLRLRAALTAIATAALLVASAV